MNCKKLTTLKKLDIKEIKEVSLVAKETLSFMAKNHISLTPKNYGDWFYVICKAKKEDHLLTDQNLFLLYEEYIKDKPEILDDYTAKEVSNELKSVTHETEKIVALIDENLKRHTEYIEDSKNSIKRHDLNKIEELHKKIKELENENKVLKEEIDKNIKRINNLQYKFLEYKKLSLIDPLTGLINRRGFEIELDKMKQKKDIYLIYIDIDDFKKINDTYGHDIGDEVLKVIGSILKNYVRKDATIFRLGGEEFAILLSDIDKKSVFNIAKRIRKVIDNHNLRLDDKIVSFTASFGITKRKEKESIKEFLKRADEAMYTAKKSGKNRIVIL